MGIEMTGAFSGWSHLSNNMTFLYSKPDCNNVLEMEYQALATQVGRGVRSLGTRLHPKSSCHLSVKHAVRLPLVTISSCFGRGRRQPER